MTAKAAKTFHITKLKSFKNMKKITMICMAAMLLLAASCKKEEQVNENGVGEFSFSVKTETSDSDSKTHLAGTSVVWDNDDVIKVINKDGTDLDFTFSKYVMSSDASTAEFNSENVTADFFKPPYTGYYPSDLNPSNYSLLQTQTYSAEGFAAGANPMIATNANNKNLYFKNLCGVLKLQLCSNEEVKVEKIIVRSKSEEKLWGNGSINSEGAFTVTNGGSNTIELDCSQADPEVILSPSKTTPTTFFIVLPVGTLSNGFEVEVIDKDSHGNWTVGTTKDNTIIRSRIRQMPVCTVKIGVQLYAGGPYWATCNLGATSPTKYGDYYAWAETEPYYTSLSWNDPTMPTVDNWKSGKENGYCWKSYPNNSGTSMSNDSGFTEWYPVPYDDKKILKLSNDAAYQYYDVPECELNEGRWRIPTEDQLKNMTNNTTRIYYSDYKGTGIAGWLYKGNTTGYSDRSIFLPLAGCFLNKSTFYQGEGDYMSATRSSTASSPFTNAVAFHRHLYIDNTEYRYFDALHRYFGETIRPIKVNN